MTAGTGQDWHRVETKQEFIAAFADRPLVDDGIRFVISASGQISGSVDGQEFSGNWDWTDGYFCRSVQMNGEDLGKDCEIIERCGNQMRYTRDKGKGDSSVVEIERLPQ